jgi:hypothetical protein
MKEGGARYSVQFAQDHDAQFAFQLAAHDFFEIVMVAGVFHEGAGAVDDLGQVVILDPA